MSEITAAAATERITDLGITDISVARAANLIAAIRLGADDELLRTLANATRLSRKATIVLPPGRYEHLSRGRGWARLGTGPKVAWGEKVDGGYEVGTPGRWSVGSTDGFNRKSAVEWVVKHIKVGDQTWTMAD